MAPRPNWKGYLKLSLVSCSVALYSATSTSQRVRFNIINKKTGNRVHNQVVDAETEEPVEQEDRVKGYQIEKGQYVLVEDEELDEVALESTTPSTSKPSCLAAKWTKSISTRITSSRPPTRSAPRPSPSFARP